MQERQTLPVLPLRGTVVFPGHATPIAVGRPKTLRAVEAASKDEGHVFAVTQRERDADDPSLEQLYSTGVIARIAQMQRGLGGVQLLLQGEQRANALQYRTSDDYIRATVMPTEELEPLDAQDPAFVALYRELRDRAMELGEARGVPKDALHQLLDPVDDPGRFADVVAGYIELPVADKQSLLETLSVEERLRRVLIYVQRQIGMHEAREQIKTQVQEELGQRQREMYLREQLKAIKKELGEDEEGDGIEALREKLEALELPKEARAEVNRELNRLERAGPQAMESQVLRTYLELMAELPWTARSDDNLDLGHAKEVLEADHYGLQDVKDRILEFLAVRQLRAQQLTDGQTGHAKAAEEALDGNGAAREETEKPAEGEAEPDAKHEPKDATEAKSRAMAKGPILLFLGPPGVGKTSIAKSIARSLGRKYVRIALGGARDEADIRGHRRTYVGAMPGRIIQGMKQAGTKNPVFLLDEVDKLGVSFQGDPASALLEVLDPAQNDNFTDHYLNVPFDLSEVIFIATANFAQNIPGPLLDRMETVDFSGYTEMEKAGIAERYLIPRQFEESGLSDKNVELIEDAVYTIISKYTREAGVRQLERQVGAVARKVARKIAAGETIDGELDAQAVRDLLGRPKVHPEQILEKDEVGVATGMYYTPAGGDIMFVEASLRPLPGAPRSEGAEQVEGWGNVSLILTGQLGDVMKESARAALTYAATHAQELGVTEDRLGSLEAHIHVPAGAVPKDGPSAGMAMATVLASAMSGRPVRRDVAMSGEVTLRGRVMPIGGVKEKVLGAHRAGVKHVILPERNEADLEDIPEEVRDALSFTFVHTLDEVLPVALVSESQAEAAGEGTAARPN